MLSSRINRVKVRNYRSLADIEVALGDLTVLVGPNGSGKSNFLDVFRFVSDALTRGLDAALLEHDRGGIGRVRRYSSKGRPYDVEISLDLQIDGIEGHYSFVLGSKRRNEYEVKSETCKLGVHEYNLTKGRVEKSNIGEAIAIQERNLTLPLLANLPELLPLYNFLTNMGFYSIFPNDLRAPQRPGNPHPLEADGTNLTSVLRDLVRNGGTIADGLYTALARVVPSIVEENPISVKQVGSYLVASIKHENDAGIFDLALESDGTLRVLGLLTALYQSPPLPFIGMEEPEMMVHPGAMSLLCDILEEVSTLSQIIITTHSPDLIAKFDPTSLRIVEIEEGATQIGSVHSEDLDAINDQLFNSGDLLRIGGLRRE